MLQAKRAFVIIHIHPHKVRVIRRKKKEKPRQLSLSMTYHFLMCKSIWCLMRDSNPQANALDPKSSVFTSFTNQACLITFTIS